MRTVLRFQLATLVACAVPLATQAQDTGRIGGTVVDAATGEPVEGVVIRMTDLSPVLSDGRGVFAVHSVPAGSRTITFEHLAYGIHERTIEVEPGEVVALAVEISAQAIELEALEVDVLSDLERRRITSGHSINDITAADLETLTGSGLTLGDLVASSLPGVHVSPRGQGLCVTYRPIRTNLNLGDCNGVTVIMDGVPVADPTYLYGSIPLEDIERVEVLSPSQAGVRYGVRNGQGALLIETKRGPVRRATDTRAHLTGFDWSSERAPYPWLEVFGASVLANAAALGISYALVDRCFSTEEVSFALRNRCGSLATASLVLLSVGLPSAGTALTARWAGATDRSRGRFVPAVATGGMAVSAGYFLLFGGNGGTQVAGGVLLGLGVPAMLTFLDRVVRIRR